MSASLALFLALAVVAVASALAMVFARNAIHAVLFMVGNFATVATLFLLLDAPFLAAVQVVVYAGAIMVLFLFVVMLMGPNPAPLWEQIPGQRPLGLLFGILLAIGLITAVNIDQLTGVTGNAAAIIEQVGQPTALAGHLYRNYLLPFEITSVLLLIGMIGAVILAKREKQERKAEIDHPISRQTLSQGD